jgi:hypothetical protein
MARNIPNDSIHHDQLPGCAVVEQLDFLEQVPADEDIDTWRHRINLDDSQTSSTVLLQP